MTIEASEETTSENESLEHQEEKIETKAERKQERKPERPEDKPSRTDTGTLFQEKIDSLHKDLSTVRKENKALKAENDELRGKVSGFELKAKKSEAISAAMSEIGEDFEIPSDKLPVLEKLVTQLQDGDDLADSVKSLVETIKTPKSKPRRFEAPWGGNSTSGKPGDKPIEKLSDAPKIDWSAQKS